MFLKNLAVFLIFSFGAVSEKTNSSTINFEGIYVSRDTINIDKSKPKEITISFLKFNKNGNVQISKKIVYDEGKFELSNSNILEYLDNFSSYKYNLKRSKITVECSRNYGEKELIDLATPKTNKISEVFFIKGDTLLRKKKLSKNFNKKYILEKTLNKNHKNIKIGNGC